MAVPLFWRIAMDGIVAKMWNIKEGSMGRGTAVQITDSISYITNSEKCDGVIAGDGLMPVSYTHLSAMLILLLKTADYTKT